ncbi:MAG TPA: hypothetical protein VFF73_13335 [Planctomycetota bacterium]|nr:hypothetical protein [Planctomycetota bacterium]
MRRRGRSVHRRRLSELTEQDALGLALPGLVFGFFAIGLVLFASTYQRAPRAAVLLAPTVAPVDSHAMVASPDSSSLAALTSAHQGEKP